MSKKTKTKILVFVVALKSPGRGGGDSHIKRAGVLVDKFEKNP